jgi:glycosyltransferase involved in cell wall biosynthesis
MEALACGLPIVATGVGGIPDIVEHGKTGIILEKGDIQSLTDASVWEKRLMSLLSLISILRKSLIELSLFIERQLRPFICAVNRDILHAWFISYRGRGELK